MQTDDLRSALEINDNSAPEEAATNINRSKLFDISPDSYKELKTELDPKAVAIERVPANIEPVTKEVATTSKEHAALTSENLNEMSNSERRLKYYKNKIIDIPELRRERNELSRKKLQTETGVLDPAEEEHLQGLNASLSEMEQQKYDVDPSGFEDFAVDVASGLGDIVRSYWENKSLIGAGAVVGGIVGAGIGAVSPIPGGALIGAKLGAGQGIAGAAIAVPFVDSYVQARDGIYNDLRYAVNDETGESLNLSHDRSKMVAQGAAAISGAAAAFAGKVFASNNPYLRKFIDPSSSAKYLIKNPALMAKMDIIGGIFKSGAAEGFEEGVQQGTEIIATELGKIDGSEESFINALSVIGDRLQAEVPYSVAVGSAAGSTFAAGTNLPAYNSVKKEYQNIQEISRQKSEVLESQNVMIQMNEDLKNTKLQQLAPEEAKTFKQKLFASMGFDEDAWFSVDDLKKFADSPDKGKKVRDLLNINPEIVKLAKDTNSNLQLSKADVLDIMTEFPDISDYMRLTPDGQNPFEIRNEAKNFVDNMTKADQARTQLMESLGIVEDVEGTQAKLKDALTPLNESAYFKNETDYQTNRAMIQPHEGVVDANEADKFNGEYQKAKDAVVQVLNEDANNSLNPRENRLVKIVDAETLQAELESLNKELTILDSFNDKKNTSEASQAIKSRHAKKGFSPSAIDPDSLPADLKEYYLKDENLKKRKVFVKGGLNLEESAALNGVESGAELLRILANTPTRESIIKNRNESKQIARQGVQDYLSPERAKARDEAFSNMTKIHIKEMEFMKSKSWPTLKRGIIKIGTKVPSVEELNVRANKTVKGMRVRDLNVNQFRNGEIKSQRLAMKQFVNSEFEQAFANKEKAAFNSELMKETIKAKDKVAKYQKFWKKVSDPSSIQSLKDAGYFDVMNNYMSLYKLDGNIKSEGEIESFTKWVKKQLSEGKPVPFIPDRLNNTQVSYKDLTVEQYQAITEFGQYILDQANTKNKFLENAKNRKEFETQEYVASKIDELTRKNIDYDETRAKREEKESKDATVLNNLQNKAKTLMSAVNNTKNIALELDEYKLNGFFYKTLVDPLVRSQTGKRTDINNLVEYYKKTIKEFYGDQKNYENMILTRLDIPEFADIDTLNNGKMRKVDLMKLMATIGDPDGRSRIENFKSKDGSSLQFETVMKVLDRELDEKDAGFVQNFFVNPYKMFEKQAFDLQKRTTGIDPDMVKGVPYTHRGKVYEGGYQPLEYQRLPDEVRIEQELEKLQMEGLGDEGGFFARMRAAEMTNQDRMKQRTGSQRPLDLAFENHFSAIEDIVHDLHFRETGIDLLKIIKDPMNVKNIKSVIGSKKFVLMLDSIKDVVSKSSDKDNPLYSSQNYLFNSLLQTGKSLHAIKTISANVMSAMIQYDSLIYVALRSGKKTPFYLSKTIAKIGSNLLKYNEYVDTASEILSDIKFEKDAIDDSLIKSSEEFIPYGSVFFENYPKLGNALTRLSRIRRKLIDASFILLREADKFNKVVTVLALSDQFLNGDIDGFSKDVVDKMSDAEKKQTLQKIVKQVVDLSLTASSRLDKTALEKNKVAQGFVNYWTDRRSRLNTITSQLNKSRKYAKAGDYKQAANQLLFLSLVSGTSVAFQNALRGDDESLYEKWKDVQDPSDALNFAMNTAFDFAKAPAIQTLESIPGIDAIMYSYDVSKDSKDKQIRPVSIPVLGVATDIVAGKIALDNLLESGLDFDSMKKKDRKALLTASGYLVGGAPTNAINKVMDAANNPENYTAADAIEDLKKFNNTVNQYIERFKDKPEAQQFIEDLKVEQKNTPQFDNDVTHLMPENVKENIKEVVSKGKWDYFNEDTGEFGVYGYTKQQWEELSAQNPDLGLTENGRLAKDGKQQEKAFEREIQDNTKLLMSYNVPVNNQNILGAHKFGIDNFIAIHEAHPDEKLSDVIGEEAKNPIFKNFDTVKSLKSYLAKQIKNNDK